MMNLKKVFFLKNEIMSYQWGSQTAIAELLGKPSPSPDPQAEMWMGAHPKASSKVKVNNKWVLLSELIGKEPEAVLGKETARGFNKRLPFLFKVLAAGQPLSIQAHPEERFALEGFNRENIQKIPINDKIRNYKDDRSKPECICALSPFTALCGFRKIDEILRLFEKIGDEKVVPALKKLREIKVGCLSVKEGLMYFFKSLMETDEDSKKKLMDAVVFSAGAGNDREPALSWMTRIHAMEKFKNDIGIFAPIFLNLVILKPGEALFLPPGQLHAYLEGTGIEIMANSDNTLRGGLTKKHVDLTELLKAVRFEETRINILEPQEDLECTYQTPAREFILSRIEIKQGSPFHRTGKKSVEIVLCTEGSAVISYSGGHGPLKIKKGDSLLIPALVDGYQIKGRAVLYKAGMPS